MNGVRCIGMVLLVAGVCAACGSAHAALRPLHVEDASLGLDCGDVFPCPHLGIAVWLASPALRVTVALHGRSVTLATFRRYKYRRYWQGFVRDTVAEHLANAMNRKARLTIEAIGRDGVVRRATVLRPVIPGWG